jgi:hypothetical protein
MKVYPMILRSIFMERPLLSVDPLSIIRVFQGYRLIFQITYNHNNLLTSGKELKEPLI